MCLLFEQACNGHSQCQCEALDAIDGGIAPAPFDVDDVGTVDMRLQRQLVLTPASFAP